MPQAVVRNYWSDPLHGYFHGLYTAEIAVRLAGGIDSSSAAKGLVLAALMHDIVAFQGRPNHAVRGSNMMADVCSQSDFWRAVKEIVREAILTHEGRPPQPKPRTLVAGLVHDADRIQEIIL